MSTTVLPGYLRSFDLDSEIIGVVSWDTIAFPGDLLHACAPEVAEGALASGVVRPRSEVEYVNRGQPRRLLGLWATLNDYTGGSYFGPILFRWRPEEVPKGMTFLVIRRQDSRERWMFVEYGGTVPSRLANLPASDMFDILGGVPSLRAKGTYNFVLTSSLPVVVGRTVISGIAHRGRTDALQGRKMAQAIGDRALFRWLHKQAHFGNILSTFPDLIGHRVPLFGADELDEILGGGADPTIGDI